MNGREERDLRTAALVAAVVAASACAFALAAPLGFAPRLVFWFAACIAGEVLWVRLPASGTTISMASCFNFAALLLLPPAEAMLAAGAATLLGELIAMRKPPVRALYNAATTVLAVWAGAWSFQLMSGGSRDLMALLASMKLWVFAGPAVAYYGVNRMLVAMVIATHDGGSLAEAWRRDFGDHYDRLSSGAVLSLGVLVAVHYSAAGMAGTLLVILPLVVAADGLRRWGASREVPEDAGSAPDERRAA